MNFVLHSISTILVHILDSTYVCHEITCNSKYKSNHEVIMCNAN
jgi:hypothetical protein